MPLIGSDARDTAENRKLGGAKDIGTAARADVQILLRVSADRTDMSVVSMPPRHPRRHPPARGRRHRQGVRRPRHGHRVLRPEQGAEEVPIRRITVTTRPWVYSSDGNRVLPKPADAARPWRLVREDIALEGKDKKKTAATTKDHRRGGRRLLGAAQRGPDAGAPSERRPGGRRPAGR
ncbi:hypothetical protein AB0D38_20630 [Streptomyces sp. NPDC048279]|uniref:hypothetical protein n=1 Tax=Streptomyces sp. NPDC048279 TaxID=3154714 RepID=UPI00342AC08A